MVTVNGVRVNPNVSLDVNCNNVYRNTLLRGCRDPCGFLDSSRCQCIGNSTLTCERLQAIHNIVPFPHYSQFTNLTLRNGIIGFFYSTSMSQYPNLQHLDLSFNNISEIPPVFSDNTRLLSMTLASNAISRIYEGAFGPLTAMTFL